MIIQPVDNNLTELKLKLANPYKVELLELLYTNSQIQVFNYNKTEILKILSSYGNIFLELSQHYFYDKVLEQNNLRSSILFNESEFEKVKDTVSLLFKKVLFFSTKTEYEEKPMYVIQVSGTSDLGAEIIEQIDCESDLNKILSRVYINRALSSQKCEQSVFICTPDESDKNLPDFDESINKLLRNKYFNSFDVSALTLAECEKCELLRKITYKKGKSFILTEQLYDDIQLKRFFG